MPKKFSEGNNMHPGNVPNELKGLSEIEEMLISQGFTVMTGFMKQLLRDLISLDVLVVRQQSSNNSM
ncbi:3230_t:CDS:2, partial [Rhizophagus irregularis]